MSSLLNPLASSVSHHELGIYNSWPPIFAKHSVDLIYCFTFLFHSSWALTKLYHLASPYVVAYLFPFKHFKKVSVQIIFSNLHHIPEKPLVMLCCEVY